MRVSEPALLSMLGTPRFPKKYVVSDSDMNLARIKSTLDSFGGDLNRASAELGISKSSIKRRLSASSSGDVAYDEIGPSSSTRRYLERNMGRWKVLNLDAGTQEACLETVGGPSKVVFSVKVSLRVT